MDWMPMVLVAALKCVDINACVFGCYVAVHVHGLGMGCGGEELEGRGSTVGL